jgi:putative intracellular protease/amidase
MEKILAVATNDATVLKGHKTGLWLSELTHVLDVVEAAGFGYEVASPAGGKVPLDEGSIKGGAAKDAVNQRFLDDRAFLDRLEHSLALQRLLTAFHTAGRPVAAVCHGVAGLVDAVDAEGRPMVKGKVVTGFSNVEDTLAGVKNLLPFLLEDALKEPGAAYTKTLVPFTERVETDGLLITGQNPQSAHGVGVALTEALRTRARSNA